MLYYRSKDDLFNDSILDSVTHRGWIEILPMSKSAFDLISLIDFFDCLSPDFICTYFNSRTYITIVAVSKYLQRNNESIKIYIKDDFSNINVFVQDGLHFIQNTSINNVNYICFKRFCLNDANNYFSRTGKRFNSFNIIHVS